MLNNGKIYNILILNQLVNEWGEENDKRGKDREDDYQSGMEKCKYQ